MNNIDWKKSVVYQIYPKSFYDSNNDGIGDLKGVIEKLDYLENLGVDYIWLTPFYVSPQKDNGYDIEDYYNIDKNFGTMAEFEEMVSEAEKRNIKIMLDMVFNHSSTENEWFKKAMDGNEKYKNFYIFKESKNGKEPTNWKSKFGGSSWEYVEKFDEYYLHLFDRTQADLNWENENVRNEIYKIVNFWIEKGVKGFRFDVINLISKPDIYEDDLNGDGRKYYTDGPNIHKYIKELNKETFGTKDNIITVGEMSSTTIDNCIKYSNQSEKELSMVFNFHHLKVDYENGDKWSLKDFDFMELKKILNQWQVAMEKGDGWNAVFWCNHDQPRIVSRFGDDKKYPIESAKMLATTIHMLRGTPYIYQGEEIGMTNPMYKDINEYKDIESINYYNILLNEGKDKKEIIKILQSKSRDNSRTPMQWDESENAGFTKGKPWINVAKNYKDINVKKQFLDENSVYNYYKKLISLRKKYDIIAYGDFKMILDEHKEVFVYTRSYNNEKLIVINNFYGNKINLKIPKELISKYENYKMQILISNYSINGFKLDDIELRPYESIVIRLIEK
ncbi:MAG: alpha,alpha-phosphotrehalase [Sarcina sp.]